MIDKNLYRETFSQLHASDRAKQEVFQNMQEIKHRKHLLRVLRGAAIAAAMVMALAVTAGAVNVATDGALFRQFTIVLAEDNLYLAQDAQGNTVSITLADGDVVTEEAGRLILHVDGEDIDITDELEAEGVYTYACDMEVVREDGSRETRTISIQVTGSPEQWTVTQDNGDGIICETTGGTGGASAAVTEPAENGAGGDSAAPKQARTAAPEA